MAGAVFDQGEIQIDLDTSGAEATLADLGHDINSTLEGAFGGIGEMFSSAASGMGSSMAGAMQSGVSAIASGISNVVSGIGLAAGGAFATSMVTGFQRYNTIQDSLASMTVQLGDAAAAAQMLDDVLEVVSGTPFNLDEFAGAASLMVSFGVEADKIPGYLEAIGEVAATKGGRANEFAQRLSTSFGQIAAMGKISNQEINEMAQSGVPAIRILANEFGVTTIEMKEMISEGLVPADEALAALSTGIMEGTTGLAGLTPAFKGTMEGLRLTLTGSLGGMKSSMARFGAGIVEDFAPIMTAAFNTVSAVFDKLAEKFEELDIGSLPIFGIIESGLEAIADADTGVLDGIFDSLSGFSELLGPVIGLFGAAGLGRAASALGPLGALIPQIGLVTGALAGLIATSPELQAALGDVFTEVMGTMSGIFEELAPILTELMGTLSGAITTLVGAIAPLIIGLVQGLVPAFTAIAAAIGPFIDALTSALVPVFAALGPIIETLAGIMADVLVGALEAITPLLEPLGNLLASVGEALGALLIAVQPLIGFLIELVQTVLAAAIPIVEAFADVFMNLADSGIFDRLSDALLGVAEALMPIVDVLLNVFSTVIADLIGSGILEAFISLIVLQAQAFGGLLEILLPFITLVFELHSVIVLLVSKGLTLVVSWLGQFVTWITNAAQAISMGGLLDGITAVTGAISGFVGSVGTFLGVGPDFNAAFDVPNLNAFAEAMEGAETAVSGVFAALVLQDNTGVDWETESGQVREGARSFEELSDAIVGVNMTTFANALIDGEAGLADLQSTMLASGNSVAVVDEAMAALTQAFYMGRIAIDDYAAAEAAALFLDQVDAAKEFGDALVGLAEKTADIRMDAFAQILEDDLAGGLLAARLDALNFTEEIENVAEAIGIAAFEAGTFSGVLDESTEAGAANLQSMEALASEMSAGLNQALIDGGGNYDDVISKGAEYRQNLLDTVPGLEENANLQLEMFTLLGIWPDQVTTQIEMAKAEESRQRLELLQGTIDRLPESVQTEVEQKIVEGDYTGAMAVVEGAFAAGVDLGTNMEDPDAQAVIDAVTSTFDASPPELNTELVGPQNIDDIRRAIQTSMGTVTIPTRYALPTGSAGGGPTAGQQSLGQFGPSTRGFSDDDSFSGGAGGLGVGGGAGLTMVNVEKATFENGVDLQELAAQVRLGLVLAGGN